MPDHGAERLRVGVLLGGRSSEREVSLSSGRQVYQNLDRSAYAPVAIFMDSAGRLWRIPDKLVIQNTCPDIEARLEAEPTAERIAYDDLPGLVDVVFNGLHGKYGDDGCIQGALEILDIPYTGSGVLGCALSLDKPMAHAVLAEAGFDVPRELVITARAWDADPAACIARAAEIGPRVSARSVGDGASERTLDGRRERDRVDPLDGGAPPVAPTRLVVLPAREGSSVGVGVVDDVEDLPAAIEAAFRWDDRVLVEEYLEGMEFSIIVLAAADEGGEPEALLPTEIVTQNPFMTYDDKYMPGRSQKITPARVDQAAIRRIQDEACRVYRALSFRGYARLDGFLMPDGRLLFTDPNSTSGMSPSSFMFHQAAEAGMSAAMVVDRIVRAAIRDHAAKRGPL